MTLEAQVLGDTAVRAADDGYEVDLHLAWYRSLPFSCLEGIDLAIDDVPAQREQLRVKVDGRELGLDDLPELDDEWWFVQDALTVLVPSERPAAPGARSSSASSTIVSPKIDAVSAKVSGVPKW